MAEVYDDRPDTSLPTGRPLTADDLRSLRLNTGVRGYRMDEVDALIARLEAEMIERESDQVTVVERADEPAKGPAVELAEEPAVAAVEEPTVGPAERPADRPAEQPADQPAESEAEAP